MSFGEDVAATTTTGIDWAKIGTNVLATLGTGLSTVGLSALQNAIAPRIEAAKQSVVKHQTAAPAAMTVQQAPAASWQKYLPYAIGGAVLLGAVYMFTKRKKG